MGRPRRSALLAVLFAPLIADAPAAQDVVAYTIVDAREIPDSLTGEPGDPEAGRRLYFDRQLTRCSGCHGSPENAGSPAEPPIGGGLALSGVGRRLSEGAVRLWLVAPQVIAPGTRMPGYYAIGQRDDPADPRFGGPLLTAGEIEDLIAYLMRQTERR